VIDSFLKDGAVYVGSQWFYTLGTKNIDGVGLDHMGLIETSDSNESYYVNASTLSIDLDYTYDNTVMVSDSTLDFATPGTLLTFTQTASLATSGIDTSYLNGSPLMGSVPQNYQDLTYVQHES
jgi:hypothetical protein